MIKINKSPHWLSQQANLNPESTAVIFNNIKISYKEFHNSCEDISHFFKNSGISENDNVGVLLNHSYDFLKVINALWFTGAVPVLLNSRNGDNEIIEQLKHADVKFFILSPEFNERFINCIFFKRIFFPFSENPEFLQGKFASRSIIENSSLSRPAIILFTSGSSGEPKAVVHTFASLFESVKAIDSFAELSGKDIWLASLPFYHIGGFMIMIRAIISGSAIVFPVSLQQKDIEEALIKYQPTHISIVSVTLKRILDNGIIPPKKIKYVFLGGGALNTQLCVEAFGKGWPIAKVYGSSETCSMVTALYPNDFFIKPESVGKPIGQNKIKIIKTDDDNNGEVLVESGALFKEYFKNDNLTQSKLIGGQYFSGDFGRIDNDGFLYIDYRRDYLIITGGENVSAKEIESLLLENEKVTDVYVFGIPDKTWGQKLCAAVTACNMDENDLKQFLKTKTAAFKIPKKIYFVKEIPKTELGKVNRTLLFKQLDLI